MKYILKLEEAVMFLCSIFMFHQLEFAWWWFPVLILTPDVSMVGYLIRPGIGALSYNIAHHKGVALIVFMLGVILSNPYLQLTGVLLFGHSSMDRVFGYGLKYKDSFTHTHLGTIGKSK